MSDARSILITGFPGFIAGRLVERLATPETNFFLLVQPAFVNAAMASIESIAASSNTPVENFCIVEGDITRPDLGIGSEELDNIRDRTTDVFHLAAVYDLAVDKDLAMKVNVEGTRNVNDFAASLTGLRRYNYVSTCYVAGKRTGHILETELEHNAGFRNHYEESKYFAELEVERLRPNVPLTIFRPSVVVGDSRTGETAKYDGIYFLIHYLRWAPGLLRLVNVGNDKVRLNLVPVDFVADAIAALSVDEAAVGKTVAIADPAALTTAELFNSIARELSGKTSVIAPPPALTEWSLQLPFSPALTGLPHAAVPYFFLSQTYDTAVGRDLLAKHGIQCPGFRDYVGNLLDFVQKNPKL